MVFVYGLKRFALERRNDDAPVKFDELPTVLDIFADFLIERVIVSVSVTVHIVAPIISSEIIFCPICQAVIF